MSSIIFTGTSSGYPSKVRACSSFIINHNKKLYQFDAGEGFCNSALKYRIDTDNISRIIISHLHPDHITGLFLELQMMYLDKRTRPLAVYVPGEAITGLKKAVEMFYLFSDKFPFRLSIKSIKPGAVYRGHDLTVTAYPNEHLLNNEKFIKNRSNKMQSYSFIIRPAKGKILYSGDLRSGDEIADLMKNADMVISEGMHVDYAMLFDLARRYKVKKLVLTHLPDDIFRRPEKLLNAAAKCRFNGLVIARDGMSLRL